MKNLIIVGAGGFGRELLLWVKDINRVSNKWNIKGFLDDNLGALENYTCDYPVIGKIEDWEPSEDEVFACAIAEPKIKEKVVKTLKSRGAIFEQIIHPRASIGEFNDIGEGSVIYPNAVLTVNIEIGNFVTILSSGIGHDCTIEDYTTISSFCGVNGKVKIGKRVFLASNVVIVPGKSIGDDSFIGAGSVVIRSVKKGSKVFGNPSKELGF